MIYKQSNLVSLKNDFPVNISKLISDAQEFELKCTIDSEDIMKTKENLFNAKGLLEIVISDLISWLHDKNMLETSEERGLYLKMTEDISRCLGMLDRKEKDLIISETRTSFYGLASFETEMIKIYFSLVIDPLIKAKEIYNEEIKNNSKIDKKNRALFYTIYEIISVVSSSLFSRERLNASGQGNVGLKTQSVPGWQELYFSSISKEGTDPSLKLGLKQLEEPEDEEQEEEGQEEEEDV